MDETKELTVTLTYLVSKKEATLDFSNEGLSDLEQIGMIQVLRDTLNDYYSII
jgi:hypothetical protein